MLTAKQERMAEALAVERLHGADGPRWIAERMLALARAGDEAGVERFRAIAFEYETLLAGSRREGHAEVC